MLGEKRERERERKKESGNCSVVVAVVLLSQLIAAIFVAVSADFAYDRFTVVECATKNGTSITETFPIATLSS